MARRVGFLLGHLSSQRLGLAVSLWLGLVAGAAAQGAPPPATAKATFAGGCFWCVEADFDKVEGVISTTSRYIGGRSCNCSLQGGGAGGRGDGRARGVRA